MKKVLLLLSFMSLISCSFINQETLELEITNKSNSVVTDILFVTASDTLTVKELKKNETVSEKFEFPFDEVRALSGWVFSLKKNNGNAHDRGCSDILSDRKKRILKITIQDDNIEYDYNGMCY